MAVKVVCDGHERAFVHCSAYERPPVRLTPNHGVPGTFGAFVDMLSRQNYIYLQPVSGDAHAACTTAGVIGDSPTAATGSLTDLFGRAAAVPRFQDAAMTRQLSSPATSSSVSVIVSKMGAVLPAQPVTMFRIVGGPHVGAADSQQQITAYRHGPAAWADHQQRPVLLPASAVRPSYGLSGPAVRQPSPFGAAELFAQKTPPALSGVPAADRGPVDVDAGRIEAEAHELTRDAAGHEMHRCRLCARVFTVMSAFRVHVATAHCRPKNQCSVCGKHFSRSWLLKGHMRTHTGERPYRCPHVGCERAFADKSNLRSHLLIHNATGKHYVCQRCNRAFAQKRYLHKHRLEVCKM